MTESHSRNLVRVLIGAALCMAFGTCLAAPVPEHLPAVAVRQPSLYRLEIALFVFYSALLLITPAFAGLVRGRLPVEISTRGAKFAEDSDRRMDLDEAAVKKLEEEADDLTQALTDALVEIDRLNEVADGDSTQREVGSKR